MQTSAQALLRQRLQGPANNCAADALGIYSVCSSHPEVLRAALNFCRTKDYPLVIESTSNQVDQYGGYTGMKPADFMQYIQNLARELNFPAERLVLGGDHLGPNAWQNESGEAAMLKAEVLVADYVRAGYRKIHLDASMACAEDPADQHGALSDKLVASRAARLCQAAEQAWQEGEAPIYIIGTEVPTPGGQKSGEEDEEGIAPTAPADARQTYQITREIFAQHDLPWERVVAMVVQPGVEFGDDNIILYERAKARELSQLPGELGLVFEAHSTDYQGAAQLRQLVEDRYAILKVGPWLTYAYREALFALNSISRELQRDKDPADFPQQVLDYMQEHPQYWQKYYSGSDAEIAYKCLYSLSDRIRYYWPQKEMERFVTDLLARLGSGPLPYSLVSQYLPQALEQLEAKQFTSPNLIRNHIQQVLRCYEVAIA